MYRTRSKYFFICARIERMSLSILNADTLQIILDELYKDSDARLVFSNARLHIYCIAFMPQCCLRRKECLTQPVCRAHHPMEFSVWERLDFSNSSSTVHFLHSEELCLAPFFKRNHKLYRCCNGNGLGIDLCRPTSKRDPPILSREWFDLEYNFFLQTPDPF